MPIQFISAIQSTTYDIQSSDDIFVLEGAGVTTIDDAIEANIAGVNNGITVTVQGVLYGQTGIDLWQNSTENNDIWIYIGSEGHVHGTEDAIAIRQGDDNVVVNYGEISAQQAGVYFQGGEATFVNHGFLTSFGNGGQGAVIFNATSDGSNIREVTNTGIIYGAPQSTGTSFYSTIQNSSGDEFHLNNSGSILADGARAVYSSSALSFVENSGLIDGEVVMTGETKMANTGTINGELTLSSSSDVYTANGFGVVTGILNANSGNDTLIGADAADRFEGGSGDDVINGGGGDDSLDGGGNNDRIIGGDGADTVLGNTGTDTIFGGAGEDEIHGGGDADTISGNDGSDTIFGDEGGDSVLAGDGDDVVSGDVGNDMLHGGNGDDTLLGGNNNDTLQGGTGNDLLDGGAQNDSLIGYQGDDTLLGNSGNDTLLGADGNDSIVGGSGSDELRGGGQNDTLVGEGGTDLMFGGAGDDHLMAGANNDTVYGNQGADTIHGGGGADRLFGGYDNDTFDFDSGVEIGAVGVTGDVIVDFKQGEDVIDFAGIDALVGVAGNQVFDFVGTAAHSGAGATLRYAISGGDTYIYGDTSANGAGDFELILEGSYTLTAEDFIL
jgi:Ca2+-binding RTX toxin-like protein